MGSKYDPKQSEIYDLAHFDAVSGLAAIGVEPEGIDLVVLTHLHLDHAGGCTALNASGSAVPAFPNARVIVQRAELEAARAPHPLSKGSYQPADFVPLLEEGVLEVVEGDRDVAPGLRLEFTGGHSPGHQVLRMRSGGSEAIFTGDIVPTIAHLKLNWLMAWDIEPRVVYEEKARLLDDCARREVLVFTAHDPEVLACRVVEVKPESYAVGDGSVVRANVQ
jgi:glyoxylase-like metal-dependent hydrolase (beta-lactamase superfamily II)